MNYSEYRKRLLKFADLIADTKPLFDAVANNVADRAQRIFIQGGVGPGGSKENYSSNPLYKNPDSAPRKFPVKGKTGESKFQNGKPHKTAYFANYAAYKKQIGRTAFVNLIEFGNFDRAFRTGLRLQGKKVVHFIKTGVDNPDGKIEGIIAKYPGVADVLPKEREQFVVDLTNYMADAVEQAGL